MYVNVTDASKAHTVIYDQMLAASPHACVGFLWVLWFTPTKHVRLIGDSKLPLAESDGMSVFVAGLEFTTPKTQLEAAHKKRKRKR